MGRHDEGFFSAKDNLRLFWESDVPEEPRAHLGIVHGYGDHCGRYRRTIDALVAEGFAVHAFDYRGHGQADGRRGHCDRFSEYVDDLELFWGRVRKAAGGKKSFLLGHSHGGLMALHLLRRNPSELAGLLLSAPYLRLAIKAPPIKVAAAKVISRLIPWLAMKSELNSQHLTRDPGEQRLADEDPLLNHVVTPRWFMESTRAQEEALGWAGTVTLPLYVWCGGDDPVAAPSVTRSFFESVASSDKRFLEYPGKLHEPFTEPGREQVWKDISSWISAHL